MLKNYITIAIRSMLRSKGTSLINIIGLAAGIAASVLILLWVADEVSYDRFHEHTDNLYRVYEHQEYTGTDDLWVYNTPAPLAPELREKFTSIKNATRFTPIWHRIIISFGNESTYYTDGYFADQQAFEMFTFSFVHGESHNALLSPNSIVLSLEVSKRFFGENNPIGESLILNNEPYTVTAVIDRPSNTSFGFSFIIPFDVNIERIWGGDSYRSWGNNSFFTYILIDPQTDPKEVEAQIAPLLAEHGQENVTLHMEPFSQSYLYNIWGSGAIHSVRIFSAVAILVLLIACINFMNLTTARSSDRAKEVGMRKVAGGRQSQIAGQFLGESILITIISLIIALGLVEILTPYFNQLAGKSISLGDISSILLTIVVGVTFFTGLVSGSYPAVFLSSYTPIKVLRGNLSKGSKKFRTVLVVFQFTLSVALITSTIVVTEQLRYMQGKYLGYKKDNIVNLMINPESSSRYETFKSELLSITGVEAVTLSQHLPNQIGSSTWGLDWEGRNPEETALFSNTGISYDFLDVYSIELIEGRAWSRDYASDSTGVIINQEAARVMGLDNPLGTRVTLWGREGQIIGVVRDFNFTSLRYKVQPLVMYIGQNWLYRVSIRVQPDGIPATLKAIENTWDKVFVGEPFDYSFFDQEFDRMYRSEERMGKLLSYFSFLAILISCLGLFGLAIFTAEQRFREIGIRKSLGATSDKVITMLVWEFLRLVLMANVLGWLLAYFGMIYWLNDYAYRISLKPSYFILASIISIVIAIATVSYQAWRASRVNPVMVLKDE